MWRLQAANIVLLMSVPCLWGTTPESADAELYDALFTKYRPELRPVRTLDEEVPVKVMLGLSSIYSLDSSTQILQTAFFITLLWNDFRLMWNQTDGRPHVLPVAVDKIWTPEPIIRNSLNLVKLDNSLVINPVIIDNNGSVVMTYYILIDSRCSINAKDFPFDTQNCEIAFTFKNEKFDNVTFHNESEISLASFRDDSTWILQGTHLATLPGELGSITFTNLVVYVSLSRQPLFYALNIVIPVVALTIINPFVFLLPVSHGERLSYCVSLLLSYTVTLSNLNSVLPASVADVCLLNIFAALSFAISGIIAMYAILIAKIDDSPGGPHPKSFGYAFIRWSVGKKPSTSNKPAMSSESLSSLPSSSSPSSTGGGDKDIRPPSKETWSNSRLPDADYSKNDPLRPEEFVAYENNTRLGNRDENARQNVDNSSIEQSSEDPTISWHAVANRMNATGFVIFLLLTTLEAVIFTCSILL